MLSTPESYASDPTTWTEAHLEAAIAVASRSLADAKGADPMHVCRILNLVLFAGGKSGKLRNDANLDVTVRSLRAYAFGGQKAPQQIKSFTPSPIQALIIKGVPND